MILSIGEILADMIGSNANGVTSFARYAGGAPFNVACNLKHLGAPVGFCGRVGTDIIGDYLCDFVAQQHFDVLQLQRDNSRNTTLAFVELDESGERKFCFYRKGTADYHLDLSSLEELIQQADIIHLGSLMLSEEAGRQVADAVIEMTRKAGKKLSFDVNYRDDIFDSQQQALDIYSRYTRQADIVKFSEDELTLFTGAADFDGAIEQLKASSAMTFVTLGSQGSLCVYGGQVHKMGTIRVDCKDTTGAGDAFYAGALSVIDGKEAPTATEIQQALQVGNICGALTTTCYGAIPPQLCAELVQKTIAANL